MHIKSYKLIATVFILLAFPLTGCQLQMMHCSTQCCSSKICASTCEAGCPTSCQQDPCQTAQCQGACGSGYACYDVDPWCGYKPCQWRKRVLARTCPQGTVRYIPRDKTTPAVFGGRGMPGGMQPQTVAYYIPPAHLQKQVEATGEPVFNPAPQPRFGHAPAPAMQQPPHRAQAIEASATTQDTTQAEEAAASQKNFAPANTIPPVDVKPSAEEATDTASSDTMPSPVIRPLDDPSDPTAPRNLIPGLTN